MHIYDLIGIGFGPSNLALAIALEEYSAKGSPVDALFIEKQPDFAWHPNMMLDNSHLQVSYLKDMVTLRNPQSYFTFLNYLHNKNRLQDFINLKTFYPSRHEFNDYLKWAASHFSNECMYGEEVIEVLPEKHGSTVEYLRIRSRDTHDNIRERLTRSLAISVGGMPSIPSSFLPFRKNPRIFHSSQYLKEIAKQPEPKRIAIIGSGQSATEIFLDLNARYRNTQIDLITRARTIKPSDDSPFVNEIFNADYTDYVFTRPDNIRAILIEEYLNTNYAAPDLALIEEMYNVFYQQKVRNRHQHRFLPYHDIDAVEATDERISLTLKNLDTTQQSLETYDTVVLATGYTRERHKSLLQSITPYLDEFKVDRNYQVHTSDDFKPSIFVQGCCEATHGLSDTLLSVIAVRTDEIGKALVSEINKSSQPPHSMHPKHSIGLPQKSNARSVSSF